MRGVVTEQQAPAVCKVGVKGRCAAHRPFGVSGQLQGCACGGEHSPVVVQAVGELQDAVAQVEFRRVFQGGPCGQLERAASENHTHVLKLLGFDEGHVCALHQEHARASSGINGGVVGGNLLGFLFRIGPSSRVVWSVLALVRPHAHALFVTNEGALVGVGHQFQIGAGGPLLTKGAGANMVGGPLADRHAQDACVGVLIVTHHRLNAPKASKRLGRIRQVGVFRGLQSAGLSGEVLPVGTQVAEGVIVTDPHRPLQGVVGHALPAEGVDHGGQLHGGGDIVQGGFLIIAQALSGQLHFGGAEREREAVGQHPPQGHWNVTAEGDISRQLEIGCVVGGEGSQVQIAAEFQVAPGKVEGVAVELQAKVSRQAQQSRHRQWHLQVQGGVLQDQSCVLLRGKSGCCAKGDDAAAGNDPAGKHVDRAVEGQVRLTRVESVCPRIVEREALAEGQVGGFRTQQQAVFSQFHRLERERLVAGDRRIGVEGKHAGFVKRQPVERQRIADFQASSGEVERVAVEREGGVVIGAQRSRDGEAYLQFQGAAHHAQPAVCPNRAGTAQHHRAALRPHAACRERHASRERERGRPSVEAGGGFVHSEGSRERQIAAGGTEREGIAIQREQLKDQRIRTAQSGAVGQLQRGGVRADGATCLGEGAAQRQGAAAQREAAPTERGSVLKRDRKIVRRRELSAVEQRSRQREGRRACACHHRQRSGVGDRALQFCRPRDLQGAARLRFQTALQRASGAVPRHRGSSVDDVIAGQVRAAVLALRAALVLAVGGEVGEASVGRGDTGVGHRLQDRKTHDPAQDGHDSQNPRGQQDPPT